MNEKDRLIEQVARELGYSENLVKKVVNHQFNSIRIYLSQNVIGEIHIPHFGRIESNQKRVDAILKTLEKRKKEKNEDRDRPID